MISERLVSASPRLDHLSKLWNDTSTTSTSTSTLHHLQYHNHQQNYLHLKKDIYLLDWNHIFDSMFWSVLHWSILLIITLEFWSKLELLTSFWDHIASCSAIETRNFAVWWIFKRFWCLQASLTFPLLHQDQGPALALPSVNLSLTKDQEPRIRNRDQPFQELVLTFCLLSLIKGPGTKEQKPTPLSGNKDHYWGPGTKEHGLWTRN